MTQITPEIVEQHNLTPEEYQKIISILKREPTFVELGVFSVMWSEHCSYKSSRVHLKNLPTQGARVIQGPGENAGVVSFDKDHAIAFKIESHNHPSFIEPYNGAATGVGGILRDVFTMGARPIANLNSLRFGSPQHSKTPFLVSGVVAGIAGYGNCMGIPTVAGEVYFDECYDGNILVNAMTVGVVPPDKIFKGVASGVGNPVMYIGSKTGRDGIHGATMASDSFADDADQKRPTVQVGDPFTEKLLLEACLELMQEDAIVGIQDMGAAGLTSSSVEMAGRAGNGLLMNLDNLPVREEGMTPYEMLLSESQERMLLVAKKGKEAIVERILSKWDLDAVVIGEVTDDNTWRIRFHGEEVAAIPVPALTDAAPIYNRPAQRPASQDELNRLDLESIPVPADLNGVFKKLISHPTLASKRWVYRQYDHQVMDQTVVLPGSDAAVLRVHGSSKGLAVTVNCNSRYCYLDPYRGGLITVAENGRNLACSGAHPIALTDCLNFGNPEKPSIMWQFVEALKGMGEACRAFDIPIVSGNVSFYNETGDQSIYPTPTVGMVGELNSLEDRVSSFFKNEGDVILLLGENKNELGGSEYLHIIHNLTRGMPPELNLETEKNLWKTLWALTHQQLIVSAHDCAEGGLASALAESCFGEKVFGLTVQLQDTMRADALLFGETQSRVVVSVSEKNVSQVMEIAKQQGTPCLRLGQVGTDRFTLRGPASVYLDLPIAEVKEMWEKGFEKKIFN